MYELQTISYDCKGTEEREHNDEAIPPTPGDSNEVNNSGPDSEPDEVSKDMTPKGLSESPSMPVSETGTPAESSSLNSKQHNHEGRLIRNEQRQSATNRNFVDTSAEVHNEAQPSAFYPSSQQDQRYCKCICTYVHTISYVRTYVTISYLCRHVIYNAVGIIYKQFSPILCKKVHTYIRTYVKTQGT